MEFDITVHDGVVSVGEEATALLAQARQMDLYQKELNAKLDNFKDALKKAMEENGIKSFENDAVKVMYKEPYTRQSVDTKKMKDEGIYELYTQTAQVKSSVALTYKE